MCLAAYKAAPDRRPEQHTVDQAIVDDEPVEEQSTEEGGTNQKPVVVFAPDCEHVAISQFFGPYVVVASRDLVAFAKGEAVTAHYLEDRDPCAMTFAYDDFKWLTATTVEYVLIRGNSRTIRTRDFREAPLSLPDMRCDDPNSPLYEPPESETKGQ